MNLTVEIIFISLLIVALFSTIFAYSREKKHRIKLDQELKIFDANRKQDFLQRAKYSELGLLAAGITHEFNNYLSIISGKTNQLQKIYRRPGAEKELARGLMLIETTSAKMGKTIKGMREIIYNDEAPIEKDILLTNLINNVLIFCGQRLKNHGIELRFINVEGVNVTGNKIELEQALLGLINNSFDAVDTLKEKWIEINAVEVEDMVDIYIRDSGHGIPVNIRSKMLEPFFSTKKGKGSGLGLPFIKGIAEKHGGSLIYVESAEHTTFLLELPRNTTERTIH